MVMMILMKEASQYRNSSTVEKNKLVSKSIKIQSWHLISLVILIKACGVAFAILVFSKYTPLIDSQLYLSDFYINKLELRTNLVQWLASSINQYVGTYLTHLAFALIAALGLIYYYITGGRRWSLLLTLLLPSTLVWSSIVGKESIYCGAMGLGLVIWSKYAVGDLRWHEVLIGALTLIICFTFRPHYAIALLWLFIATFSLKNLKDNAIIFLILLLLIGATLVFFLVWDELLFRGFSAIEPTARASRFEFFGINIHSPNGFEQFKTLIPLWALISIIGPLPTEALKRIELLPFLIEGIIILFSPLIIYGFAIKHSVPRVSEFKKIFWWCLIPAILILILIHAPFGILNPGSAVRWRTNFEQIFYLAPLLLFYRFTDKNLT